MKRKALGKGLRSLIPEAPRRTPREGTAPVPAVEPESPSPSRSALPAEARPAYPLIDIDRIVPNRQQPREQFDEESLDALARSLKADGILQPVLVRPLGDGRFGLIAGERRWRAAQRAGLLRIPAVIKDIPEDRVLEMALIENLQREELNPIEEARAYRVLIDEVGLTQQQVADRIGKRRTTVANMLRLLALAEAVQRLVRSGQLSMGHARAIVALDAPSDQIRIAERCVKDGLSVREVETLVARLQKAGTVAPKSVGSPPLRDPNVAAAEETLQRALGTKVRILQGRKGTGRVELHFFSPEELDRLYGALLRAGKRSG